MPDATADPRFADNPLVTGAPGIRFYAGFPLRTATGAVLGTLCVLGYEPRPGGLTGAQERLLRVLASEDEKPLRGSLQRKASRYGRLDGPYIVAVGEEPFSPGDVQDHRADALYGSSAVVLHGPEAGRPLRLPDGSWRRGRSWRHTRVSGVLLLAGLRPWNAKDAVPELWLNPAAALSVPARLPYWRVQRVEESAGQGRLRTEPPAVTPASFWADSPGNFD